MDEFSLTYSQSTGAITDAGGCVVASGWSGCGEHKNRPESEGVVGQGPLPRGRYELGPWEAFHKGLGPLVAHLEQVEGERLGRDGFFIHGASMSPDHYGEESRGCIVLPRSQRELLQRTGVTHIQVVA